MNKYNVGYKIDDCYQYDENIFSTKDNKIRSNID